MTYSDRPLYAHMVARGACLKRTHVPETQWRRSTRDRAPEEQAAPHCHTRCATWKHNRHYKGRCLATTVTRRGARAVNRAIAGAKRKQRQQDAESTDTNQFEQLLVQKQRLLRSAQTKENGDEDKDKEGWTGNWQFQRTPASE